MYWYTQYIIIQRNRIITICQLFNINSEILIPPYVLTYINVYIFVNYCSTYICVSIRTWHIAYLLQVYYDYKLQYTRIVHYILLLLLRKYYTRVFRERRLVCCPILYSITYIIYIIRISYIQYTY